MRLRPTLCSLQPLLQLPVLLLQPRTQEPAHTHTQVYLSRVAHRGVWHRGVLLCGVAVLIPSLIFLISFIKTAPYCSYPYNLSLFLSHTLSLSVSLSPSHES